jgi:monovalent cation/proton antiporter, MnhG/PhaG subunit
MTNFADLPAWAALLTAFFLLLGSGLTLLGTIGLLQFKSFYERVHAPTLGTTWGAGGILIASIICFSILQSRPVLHEILIAIFLTVTTPVSLMLLARAALYRDRTENKDGVPPFEPIAENSAHSSLRENSIAPRAEGSLPDSH